MDFPRLTVFLAVARHLSFRRAAESLHLSQPAVSKHIQRLEAELGLPLLERRAGRVALTEAGRLVQDYGQRVLLLSGEMRHALGELSGLQRGTLRLGASTTPGLYLLPGQLARFRPAYPNVEASLVISNSADISRRVASGELEMGFVGVAPQGLGLQVRPYAEDEIVLVAPAGRRPALAAETWIMREPGSGTREIAEAGLAAAGLRPARTMELAGCEAVKRAVVAGLGVGFVSSRAVAPEVAQRRVAVVAAPGLRFRRQLYLVTRQGARPSPAAQAFMAQALASA